MSCLAGHVHDQRPAVQSGALLAVPYAHEAVGKCSVAFDTFSATCCAGSSSWGHVPNIVAHVEMEVSIQLRDLLEGHVTDQCAVSI
jgi:hypothetical protein